MNKQPKKLHSLPVTPKSACHTLDFSPNGELIAASTWNKHVHCWNVSTGERVWREKAHSGPVYAARFSADGKSLISCDAGKKFSECIVWSAADGEITNRFEIHPSAETFDVVASPNGAWLAFILRDDENCSLKVFSFDGKSVVHSAEHYEYPPEFAFFSKDSKSLFVFADRKLERWSTQKWKCRFTAELLGGDISCAVQSVRPSRIYAGDRIKRCVLAINPKDGTIESKLLENVGNFANGIRSLRVVGNQLIASYLPGSIVQYSIKNDTKSVLKIDQNDYDDEPMAISCDGQLVSTVNDSKLEIWEFTS